MGKLTEILVDVLLIFILLGIFAWVVTAVLLKTVFPWLYDRVWDFRENRLKRLWRRGQLPLLCDHCLEPAHYMIIGRHIMWSKGIKRCWRHQLVAPAQIAMEGEIVFPVNRDTAWKDDHPPVHGEKLEIQMKEAEDASKS